MPSNLRTREGTANSLDSEKDEFHTEWSLYLPAGKEWHSKGIEVTDKGL